VPAPDFVPLDHARFRRVDRNIFVRRVVADCMSHGCVQVADEGVALPRPRPLLEACCQYGADVDLAERDNILAHAAQIRSLLDVAAQDAPWFTTEIQIDPDYPSGQHVRTATHLEGGWDFHQVKPHICRLFPMSYEDDAICISDDYEDYDCADAAGAPTLYRVARPTLDAVFGAELVAALDRVEATVPAPGLVTLGKKS
jgi:hypothetical protein